MATKKWYNPTTWFQKTPTTSNNISTANQTSSLPSVFQPKASPFTPTPTQSKAPTSADVRTGTTQVAGKTYTTYKSPSGGTFIGGEAPSYKTTADTGTGYNPATGTQEGKMPTIQSTAVNYTLNQTTNKPLPNSISAASPIVSTDFLQNKWMLQPSSQIKSGTISPNESPFYSYADLQKNIDVNRFAQSTKIQTGYVNQLNTYASGLQSQINTGNISYDTATGLLNTKTTNLNTAMNVDLSKINYGNNIINPNIPLKDVGTFIADTIPMVSFSKALKLTQESPDYYSYATTSTKINPAYVGNLPKFGNTPEATSYVISGAINTLIPTAFGVKAIERGIISEQFAGLSKAPIIFKEINIGEDISLATFKANQEYGNLIREFSGAGKVISQGENKFIMPVGKLQTTTSGEVWNILNAPLGTKVFGYEEGMFGTKGITKQGENIFSFIKTNYQPTYSASSLYTLNKPLKMNINLKTGGDFTKSFGLSKSTAISPDIFGNQRYFTFGTKLSSINNQIKLDVPVQFGTTTIISKPSWIDLGGGFEDTGTSGVTIFRGGGTKTPLSKTFGSTIQIQKMSAISNIPSPKINPSNFGIASSLSKIELFTGLVSASSLKGIISTTQQNKLKSGTITSSISTTIIPNKNQFLINPAITKTKNVFGVTTIQPQAISLKSNQKMGVASMMSNAQAMPMPMITTSAPPLTFGMKTPFPFPILLKPSFDFGMSTRKYKGKQRKKYMPSFEAFAFGIKGKQPKGIETGARTRPIPKGFSLAFNKPSYKFNTPVINFNKIKMRRR
jgi:hypothetical protein